MTTLRQAEEFLTAQAIADHLGVAERTVRRWVAAGELHAERRGRGFAIRLSDAEERAKQTIPARASSRAGEREKDRAYAELEGRYLELKDLLESLRAELSDERRRAARLEVELELRAA